MEIKCREATCQFAPQVEFASYNDARFEALRHAWEHRGHVVELWMDGSVKTFVIADVKPWVATTSMDDLKHQVKATQEEAIRAIRFFRESGNWPPNILQSPAWVLISSLSLDPSKHVADFHCLVDDETGRCVICTARHNGEPCQQCGGKAYHRLPCIIVEPRRAIEPVHGGKE